MANKETRSTFSAKLLRPKKPGDGEDWAFVVLPKEASAKHTTSISNCPTSTPKLKRSNGITMLSPSSRIIRKKELKPSPWTNPKPVVRA